MEVIDLHGGKHEDVTGIIIEACSKNETPFVVITGKSERMKRIVSFACAKFDLYTKEKFGNPGRLIVCESR